MKSNFTVRVDVEQALEFEEKWDHAFGYASRPYRDLLGYIVGRLIAGGGTLEQVLEYTRDLFDEFVRPAQAEQKEGAS